MMVLLSAARASEAATGDAVLGGADVDRPARRCKQGAPARAATRRLFARAERQLGRGTAGRRRTGTGAHAVPRSRTDPASRICNSYLGMKRIASARSRRRGITRE